jgi:cation:H+ antiporter
MLVRGAARLAAAIGISPLVIGLTIVAFGTSAPELAVSAQASLLGQADIALGNVIGSNIFNVLFILGLSALVAPLIVAQQLVRLDVPIMIGVSVLTVLFALDGVIAFWEGAILFAGIITYTALLIVQSRREQNAQVEAEYRKEYSAPARSPLQFIINIALVLVGLATLVYGSRLLVSSAVMIAEYLGVSQLVIGLTIVAAGTSLPEVATSVVASIRGERDIAVGNVVGSNIFNLLSVLGVAAMLAPNGVQVAPSVLRFDLPVMLAVAVACLPIFFSGYRISRWKGALFLGYYIAYTYYLILDASGSPSLPRYNQVMLAIVIPLTVATLVVITYRSWRAGPQVPQIEQS